MAVFFVSGCTTVPRHQDKLPSGSLSLKEICEAARIPWNWDSVSQVITLEIADQKVKALVGSSIVLFGNDKVMLSRPIRFEQSQIVVPPDFKDKIIERFAVKEKAEPFKSYSFKKVREIVIDAGHGGKDPGALGHKGIKEKNVVLDIALRVKRVLEQHGFKVRMTRQSDVFLTLQQRTEIASRGSTDVFVSIHANSNPNRSVQGLEVYYAPDLSDDDKKEEQRRENLRLMAQHLEMKRSDSNLQKIVADMLYTYKQGQSHLLARKIAQSTSSFAEIKNRGIKEARFFVLRNTLIPAVLVETGYVTNSKEERLLTLKAHRQKLAHGIAHSILRYVQE